MIMKHVSRYGFALLVLALGSTTMAAGCAVDGSEPESPTSFESASLDTKAAPMEEQSDDAIGANAGCATLPDDPSAPSPDGTPDDEQIGETESATGVGASSPEGSAEEAGIIAPLGKKCWATCTVSNYGGGSCPATVVGYGNTTFLGGCNKACNKAEGDAASQLPPGCVLYSCNLSGC